MKIYNPNCKKRVPVMNYRTFLTMTLCSLVVVSISTSFLLSSILQTSFAQSSSSPSTPEMSLSQGEGQAGNQLEQLDVDRQQYLSTWNNTAFGSQFDVFIAEGTQSGYGVYREHLPANVFRPGETIVLYVEPVGFGHQPITDASTQDGANSTATSRTLYWINMTVDIIISDSSGSPLQTLEDLPAASFISHRQNTEFPLEVTLTQEEPFPVGDYIVTYVVHDEVTGQSFQIDKRITIDENATTGALPLPDIGNDNNSVEPTLPEQQLEERSEALQT
jgi:hypothetical protein